MTMQRWRSSQGLIPPMGDLYELRRRIEDYWPTFRNFPFRGEDVMPAVDIYEKDGGFFNAFTVYNEEEGINFKDTVEALYDRMGGKAVNDLNRFCEFLIKMQKTPERMEELIAECNLDEPERMP